MKKIFWLMIGALISTSALADQPPVPAAASTAPAAATSAPSKKKTAARPAAQDLRSVPLVAGPAIISANHVNVRGQPGLHGEIITRMTNGESVTVVEEIRLKISKPEEPSAWAKIVLPEKVNAWVHASFVDPSNMSVKPKKLNVRGGPGENYSVLGTLQQGDIVKEVSRKGDWIEIANKTENKLPAYAYMAAQYLKQEPAAATAIASTEPATATTVTDGTAIAATTVDAPVTDTAAPVTDMTAASGGTNEILEPVVEEPPPPRIVQREGIVRGTFSIQAPTKYELISEETRRPINYLHSTAPGLDLSRYKGLHIIVVGEEGLDERWKNTPVLTIQRIQVLD